MSGTIGAIALAAKTKSKKIATNSLSIVEKKAYSNLSNARGLFIQKHGIGSIFRPKFWVLTVSRITLSQPYFFICATLIFCVILMAWFFGLISLLYYLFYLKSIPCVIINVVITTANAIWFAFNGVTQLIMNGFITLLNSIAFYFIHPIITVINALPFVGDISWSSIAIPSAPIELQPPIALAYIHPAPVTFEDPGTLFYFRFLRPGVDPYIAGEYVTVIEQSGAQLVYPKFNPKAISEDWICTIDVQTIRNDWAAKASAGGFIDVAQTWGVLVRDALADFTSDPGSWILKALCPITSIFDFIF